MKATVYVANLLPIDVARIAQSLGLSGTVHDALGFGAWGIEPTTVVEFGGIHREGLVQFFLALFKECPNEEAFYLVVDGITDGANVYRYSLRGDIPRCTA